jgi:tetratricopeptide (TPR) repeat protein
MSRRFHPWEGGEGLVSGQFVAAHIILGRDALSKGDAGAALAHFRDARRYPQNLGEGKHLLTPETDLDYFEGVALSALGRHEQAAAVWKIATEAPTVDRFAYYRALAQRRLGSETGARAALQELRDAAERQLHTEVKIDYFATSLPNFLLFEDDLQKRKEAESLFARGLASAGLGDETSAVRDLQKVLQLDRNHLWARIELQDIMATTGAEREP